MVTKDPVLEYPDDVYYTGTGTTWDIDLNGNKFFKLYNPMLYPIDGCTLEPYEIFDDVAREKYSPPIDKIIISECDKYVSITVVAKTEQSLSWETLQQVKDEHYPDIDFVEVYPKRTEIINKANERHLIHRKGFVVPKLCDLERPSKTRIFKLK